MSTTKTVQVSKANVAGLVAAINVAVEAGRNITINGETPVIGHSGYAATSWQNGSMSFKVKAKKPGAFRDVYVKVGHMATITSEAPEDHEPATKPVKPTKTKAAKPRKAPEPRQGGEPKSKGDRHPITATVKGETGYLSVRTVNGKYAYAVTMDPKSASLFSDGSSAERHIKRATAAGIDGQA